MNKYEISSFNGFDVYKFNNEHVFVKLGKSIMEKYDGFFDWAFCDESLLRYIDFQDDCEAESLDDFQRVAVLKALKRFIDNENIGMFPYDRKYDGIYEILKEEDLLFLEGENTKIRKDKVGKIGELFFYNILADYFHFTCIFNKANLTSSFNMSVYGMDELFYSPKDNLLMFGEAKFCESLDNGIGLIEQSLLEYEDRLNQEFQLILSSEVLRSKVNLPAFIKENTRRAFDFNEFVKLCGITTIGIPIFIMHGKEENIDDIITKLSNIKLITINGLNISYIFVSVPIKSKKEFVARLTYCIDERLKKYGK